jgi:hypothetical protein
MHRDTRKHLHVSREALTAFAWSAPMRDLAGRIGLSDVGLRKILKANGIVMPVQGHWNRIHAGQAVPGPPAIGPRRPGETGRIRLDERFCGHLPEIEPMPVGGPFASTAVPEALDELRSLELKALKRVRLPRSLERPHPGLAKLLRREEQTRRKALEDKWYWSEPVFDTPLGQRKLKLVNALFFALASRGHDSEAWEQEGELVVRRVVGDTDVRLSFSIVRKFSTEMKHGRQRPARDLPASTPLRIALQRDLRGQTRVASPDGEAGAKLEAQIAQVAADIIVAGEASFRQSLVEAVEWEEQQRKWAEERERKRLAELEQKRIENLKESGRLLAEANQIRALAAQVEAAVRTGMAKVSPRDLDAWKLWALSYADRIDPVCTGQVMTHVRPPE